MAELLHTVDIEPAGEARSAVIWLHGLGANANDFVPVVPHLQIPPEAGLRFVFPDAPERPVTVNGGMIMPAWYDILSIDLDRTEDAASVLDSATQITALIERERERGIPDERIVLAGFSQGAAMTLHVGLRHDRPLAGLMALSGYLPLRDSVAGERNAVNQDVALFMAHGLQDPVVPHALGTASRDHLAELGYNVDWREYPMQHEVTLDEITDIGAWLRARVHP